MAVNEKYQGTFPAFYACYDEEGNVSKERIAKLAKFYLSLGIPGLYVTGSSGESIFLSVEERKLTLETVMEAVGGKMTIIAHVAAPSTKDSIELAQHAEAMGVDAISMLPGIYYGLNEKMVKKFWCDVLDATQNVPLFIYNIPGTTNGFNLSTKLYREMLETGRVAGIKNSSESVQDILRFRAAGGEDVAIFNGPDEQYLAGRLLGASGGIGGTYGYMPELYLKLEELIRKKDLEQAFALQKEITEIIYFTLQNLPLYTAAKGILKMRGIDVGGVRPPFLPLTQEDEPILQELHDKIQAVMEKFCKD